MNRGLAIEALLSELAKFAPVINQDFPLEEPEDVDFFSAARVDLEGDAFSDESIERLIKLLISAELWLREFAETGQHKGILYSASFVSQAIRFTQQKWRKGEPVYSIEVLIFIRRNAALKSLNGFPYVTLPIGVSTIDIAMTVTSILDAAIQPFMESSGWQLGVLPDFVPQLMHPNADEAFRARFGN